MTPMIGQKVTAGQTSDFRPATLRGWQYGSYVRDQFELTKKMSVSVGLRYEYYPLMSRADRGLEVFNFATNLLEICGVAGLDPHAESPSRRPCSPRGWAGPTARTIRW